MAALKRLRIVDNGCVEMPETIHYDAVKRRLDVIIGLMLKQQSKDMTAREQIALLNSMGLKYNEIAQVLGKNAKYISKELAVLKKSAKEDSNLTEGVAGARL